MRQGRAGKGRAGIGSGAATTAPAPASERAGRPCPARLVPLLALPLLLGLPEAPAQAQQDWFRPPGNVGQPSRQPPPQQQQAPQRQRRPQTQQAAPSRPPQPLPSRPWNPFQPLIDLFQPEPPPQPRYAAPPRGIDVPPPPPAATRTPAIEAPAEARGQVYASTAAAREDQGDSLKSLVLVLGDENAATLAQGLADTFAADRKGVAVVGRSEPGSGFAPASPYDWISNGRSLVSSETPNAVVVFAGGADLAPIAEPGGTASPAELFDERWRAIYGKRLDDFLLGLKLGGRPVFLVGLPPVDDAAGSTRNQTLNALLKERAERAGVTYVDVWDGFVDENGQFTLSGPAVDGQRRRLRAANGSGFTRAGGRKLAFFVDRELGPVLEREEGPITAQPGEARPSIILLTGAAAGTAGGARTLAGAPAGATPAAQPAVTASSVETAADAPQNDPARLLLRGEPLPTVSGRTDDFSWVPAKSATTVAPVEVVPASTGASGTGAAGAPPESSGSPAQATPPAATDAARPGSTPP